MRSVLSATLASRSSSRSSRASRTSTGSSGEDRLTRWARSGPLRFQPSSGRWEPGDDVRQETIRALRLIGEPSVPALIQALKHSHPSIRRGAAQALGVMGETKAVPVLIEALKDGDAWSGMKRSRSRQDWQSPGSQTPLIETLNDAKEHVRMAAMATLCSLGEASIDPLIHALVDANEDVSRGLHWLSSLSGNPPSNRSSRRSLTRTSASGRGLSRCSGRSGTPGQFPP